MLLAAVFAAAQVSDSAPSAASSSGPAIPLMPAPNGSLPPWLWQAFMLVVLLYVIASAVGAASPNSKVGAICRRWTSDIRNLAARAPAPEGEKAQAKAETESESK